MAKVNAQQWLEKWGRRMNSAGTDITAGVDRVKEAPGIKAAAAQALMLQHLTEAITSGKWAAQVGAVTLTQWQDDMKTKGIPRIAQGVTAAQKSKTAIIGQLLAAVDAAAESARALPRGSLEQNIARSVKFMTEMSANAPKRAK